MGSGKQEKRSKSSLPNKNPKRKRLPLGPNRPQKKKKKTKTTSHKKKNNNETKNNNHSVVTAAATSAEQLSFFVGQYQSANAIQLSSLELESITGAGFAFQSTLSIMLLWIKKLIDMEALGLTRLAVIVLDMQTDVKGYSLFTLPQVRDEFWDLYKNYLHPRLVQGDLRICLYGLIPISSEVNKEVTGD
ncbi:hypothetical protein TEA_012232 [Camellia sinensis var. sinensis]|uniref:Uncharacterized protein n=1 Tax=Camellia sinensis var. sinensis TaxID=542762 RepID=A0A4S4E1M3_CAMSN|nr:hypothetical protein TEA_012232 [Camellia sinensis var. sinensis]